MSGYHLTEAERATLYGTPGLDVAQYDSEALLWRVEGILSARLEAFEVLAAEWNARALRAIGERRVGVAEGDSSHAHYARTCRNHADALRAAIRKDADA